MKITLNADELYRIYTARDARYDGKFFTCVTSTKIFCRPVCSARTPKFENCRFVRTATEAEAAGFRACKRCRPELAPGAAPVDDSRRIAELLSQRLLKGDFDHIKNLEEIAAQFDIGARQLRRIVEREIGMPLVQLLQARRLMSAQELLANTDKPITEITFASGFSSLRRFNDAFRKRYGLTPRDYRKQA